jgi:hypothetical protein
MTVEVKSLKTGGFVVSENGVWIEGIFSTEEAARKAVGVDPHRLSEIWQSVLKDDPDNGTISEAML